MKLLIALLLFNFQIAFGTTKDTQEKVDTINAKLANATDIKCNISHIGDKAIEMGTIEFKMKYGVFIKYSTQPIVFLMTPSTTTYYDYKLDQKSEQKTHSDFKKIFENSLKITEENFEITKVEDGAKNITVIAQFKTNGNVIDDSKISMLFNKEALTLLQIKAKHDKNSPEITIENCKFDITISPERFKSININQSISKD